MKLDEYTRVLVTKVITGERLSHILTKSVWLPVDMAVVGKVLKCKDIYNEWNGWKVDEVYETKPGDWEICNGMIVPTRWTPELDTPEKRREVV